MEYNRNSQNYLDYPPRFGLASYSKQFQYMDLTTYKSQSQAISCLFLGIFPC